MMFPKVVVIKGCPSQQLLIEKLRETLSVPVEQYMPVSWFTPGSLVLANAEHTVKISNLQNAGKVISVKADEDIDSVVGVVVDFFLDLGMEEKVKLPIKLLSNEESPSHERIPITPQ